MTLRRSLVALWLIGPVSSCTEPTGTGNPRGFGSMALRIPSPPSLLQFAPGLVVEQVKVVVARIFPSQESSIPLDSVTVRFNDGQNTRSAGLSLLVVEGDTLGVVVTYLTNSGTTLFQAFSQLIVGPNLSIPSPPLQPFYVGPGSNIGSISLSPADSSLSAGDSLTFDPQPFDVQGLPVPQFYVSWSTDDPRVPIDARGQIVAPSNLTKLITVNATAPNGEVGTTTLAILGAAALGISPDSIEKLPGTTQIFRVTVGGSRTSQFIWSVNGVDGGDAATGTINVDGFYSAPAAVPSPNRVRVCARDATAPSLTDGCAVVVLRAVPTVGADLIVLNDQNLFDGLAMSPDSSAGNRRLVRNLVNFGGTGARASGRVVWYDQGRSSPCWISGECNDTANTRLDAVIQAEGYAIDRRDFFTPLTSIPPTVKVAFLWMPALTYQEPEINVLKRFAAEGGRIVFIGDQITSYTQAGIATQNQFFLNLGSQMLSLANEDDCGGYHSTPSASLGTHPLLNGVNRLLYNCAAELQAGPDDVPLFYDQSGTRLLGAITKVDVTPIQDTRDQAAPFATRRSTRPTPAGREIGGTR